MCVLWQAAANAADAPRAARARAPHAHLVAEELRVHLRRGERAGERCVRLVLRAMQDTSQAACAEQASPSAGAAPAISCCTHPLAAGVLVLVRLLDATAVVLPVLVVGRVVLGLGHGCLCELALELIPVRESGVPARPMGGVRL